MQEVLQELMQPKWNLVHDLGMGFFFWGEDKFNFVTQITYVTLVPPGKGPHHSH